MKLWGPIMIKSLYLGTFLTLSMLTTAHADPQPRPVQVETVMFVPQVDQATYAGTVQARVQADLGFRVGGKIISRTVNIGDHVTTGQVLAVLDPVDAKLTVNSAAQAVRAAEAEAVNARADFERYQQLGKNSPAWLPSDFDKRKAALDGAEAHLAQAKQQLALAADQVDYTTLRADAEGVVTNIHMEIGQVVAAGQTVASLAHLAETEIVVDVPENRLAAITAADSVVIHLWSQPTLEIHGRTREIGALADPVSRTFAVKVTILDPSPAQTSKVALGMTASIRFSRPTGVPVALIPASAVVASGSNSAVWVLDPAAHKASLHTVHIGAWTSDGRAAITDGVASGDQVITAGASLLDAATPVTAWAGAIR